MSEAAFVHPVEAVSVVDRVTSEIRRAILGGRLPAGQEFSLRQVAGQLGVSFIPVREALRSLEAEGLLVTRRGRSATVAPLDEAELEGICQLRRLIEPELAAQAHGSLSPEELDRQDARIAHCEESVHSVDDRFDEYRAIYLDLLRPAATNWDLRVVQMLCRAVERYIRSCYDQVDSPVNSAKMDCGVQLRELVVAFRGRDPEGARVGVNALVSWAEQLAGECLKASS